MTRVKICGITREEDALAAAEAGADAIGLVFYPASPRYVSIEQARKIACSLPPFVSAVGLFVDADAAAVWEVLDQVPLSMLQFHGDEPDSFCRQFGKPYLKALRVRPEDDLDELASRWPGAAGILLDSYKVGVPGGTGETFDWSVIPAQRNWRLVLAGGLDADNVAGAVERAVPWAVDVSGGVELTKGIKDSQKINAFIKEVKRG